MLQAITPINNRLPISGAFAISPIAELSDDLLHMLSSDEQDELSSFKNRRRKKEFVAARLLLRKMSRQMGMKGEEFIILKDEMGRPSGKCGANSYYVSIAHTRDDVFCGITKDASIGVDLEPVNRPVTGALRERMIHPDESQSLKGIDAVRLWTIKEAFIKLEGCGLRMNMNDVQVQRDKNDFFVQLNNDKTAKICSFQADNNWLAVAFYHKP
ncbi:MAG TPA: 4'-phosphopantetheinyl transferase superfamily protein [Balneolaceae bacterium]|nr:4'-phosphopantetheinyl transferase superfamily protein [Balneolaceae bacterium]